MKKVVKIGTGQSPLFELSKAELKLIKEWGDSRVYQIIQKVMTRGIVKDLENFLLGEVFSENNTWKVAEKRGELRGLRAMLKLPESAQKILEEESKE